MSELGAWTDGVAKREIVDFVAKATTAGGNDFVRPAERIATFDNDGTLWCEKPLYVQADFILRKWAEMAAADPKLREQQPFKAVAEQDRAWLGALLDHVPELVKGVSEAFGGMTVEAFEKSATAFFQSAKHPTLNVPYTQVTYRPMRELIGYLQNHDFRVYVCSAGGRDFVRTVSEELYGIPRDQVIGTSAPLEWKDGRLVRTTGVEQPIDDGAGKPVHIWARTGRLPLFAAGNADGDTDMLTAARFALLVHHDDADREFAYDQGAETALAQAKEQAWTVASMRHDFSTVF